jgi:lipid-A-disaccharide synthase
VESHYIGHPYFDELHERKLDDDFLAAQRARPGTIIALLPGSRRQEIKHNFGPILEAARILYASRPDVRFLVACLRPEHAHNVEERLSDETVPIEVHAGRTAEIIHLAHSAIAKSGSVSLEMLYHGTPAVVVYQVPRAEVWLAKLLMKCKYASLVNLLLDKPLFPEYLGFRLPTGAIAASIRRWLENPAAYAAVKNELASLRERVAKPGACDRAAGAVLEVLAEKAQIRRAG